MRRNKWTNTVCESFIVKQRNLSGNMLWNREMRKDKKRMKELLRGERGAEIIWYNLILHLIKKIVHLSRLEIKDNKYLNYFWFIYLFQQNVTIPDNYLLLKISMFGSRPSRLYCICSFVSIEIQVRNRRQDWKSTCRSFSNFS